MDPDNDSVDTDNDGDNDSNETAAQEATEQHPIIYGGGGLVLVTDHHRNMFDHKKRHKEKHGY